MNTVLNHGLLNEALRSRIPPKIRKGRHRITLELHLISDYGNPSEAEASYPNAMGDSGKTGGTQQLLVGRKSDATRYTLTSAQYGSVTCQIRVVCTYHLCGVVGLERKPSSDPVI